jgi:hypothetical protein
LQVNFHTFLVRQMNASDATDKGAAAADGTVVADKIADLPYA